MNPATPARAGRWWHQRVRLLVTALALITAAVVLVLPAGRAQASPTTGADVGTMAGPADLPYYGSNVFFPTWIFGSTTLCVYNYGSQYGEARVQTTAGAPEEWIPVFPGQSRCISRWWGGISINVMNNAFSPLTAWTY